jgi:hypothetical protein
MRRLKIEVKVQQELPSCPCCMKVFVCAAWNIWKDRNDIIFKDKEANIARWNVRFQNDLQLHIYRMENS